MLTDVCTNQMCEIFVVVNESVYIYVVPLRCVWSSSGVPVIHVRPATQLEGEPLDRVS